MSEVKISDLNAIPGAIDGTEILPIDQSGTTYRATRDDLLHNVTDPADLQDAATKNYVDLAVASINTNTGSRIVSGGGVAWTGTNFDYIISACEYIINGVQYSSAQTSVTLDPADPSLNRIDVFYADVNGLSGVITGTPATNPVAPSVDPATQIYLTFANVDAGATEPTITNVDIYLENTEWTTSTNSAGTIDLASTNNPYAGTKDIEGTATVSGNLFTAVKPSGTLAPGDYANLVLQIRSKATWANPKAISIFWMNGVSSIGTAATLKQGSFGFDSSNTTSYQQIVIPISAFNPGTSDADRIRFQVTGGGSSIGWYIDNIILQGGGSTITAGDFSTSTATSVVNEIVVFADTTGKLGKRSSGTGLAKLTNGVLGTAIADSDYTANAFKTINVSGQSSVVADSAADTLTLSAGTRINITTNATTDTVTFALSPYLRTIGCTLDGGGSALSAGKAAGYFTSVIPGNITGWSIGVDNGSATMNVWKVPTGTATPVNSNTILVGNLSLSSGTYIRSTNVANFSNVTVAQGDIFAFYLSNVATATELTFQAEITPS